MKKDNTVYLRDISRAIAQIRKYIAGMDDDGIEQDEKTQDAVIRQLMVIGEAANRVDRNTQEEIPTIPWRNIIGMTNILVHNYEGVITDEVWKTITPELDSLERAVSDLI